VPLVLAPWALACSVPQFDPAKPQPALSIDQLIETGHYRRALAEISKMAQGASTAAQAARRDFLLSRIELGFGHPEESLQLAEKALAADPKNVDFHVEVAAAAGRLAEHSSLLKQIGYAKRVKKELDAAIALNPKSADAIYGLMLYSNLAPPFLGGDKAAAQRLAEQLTTIDATRGYLAQARLSHDRKDPAEEEALLQKALAVGPGSYEAHTAYAVFAEKSEPTRAEQADEHACEALYLDAYRVEAWRMLTEMAASAGCPPEVDGLIATEQRFNDDDLSPAYFAAIALIGDGKKLDMARALLKRYLEKPQEGDAPSAGLARYQLALISEKQGNAGEALELMRLALNEDPTLDQAKKDIKRLEKQ
jgi:tetratricopeptide (TPR) repeat protein